MNSKRYSIGDFADRTGVSVRTLHFYDEKGLLKPEKHPRSGHRMYSDEDVKILHKIMTFKFFGYRLEQINEVLHEPSFDISIIESLRLQERKFLADKEQIEKVLATIKRTIALIEDEGEVDSTILMSLIASMQTEKEQRMWAEQFMDKDIVESIFPVSDEEKMELEKVSLQFFKGIKQLVGRPVDDEEVQKLLEDYFTYVLEIMGKETIDEVLSMFSSMGDTPFQEDDYRNIEEELEKLVPTPFSEDEMEWLDKVMEYFMKKHNLTDFLSS